MPDPTTVERLKGLIPSATELQEMTGWPDALIEDYLSIFENLVIIANLLDIEIDQKIEEIATDFLDGSLPFAEGGLLVEDNANLSWNSLLVKLLVNAIKTNYIDFDLAPTSTVAEGRVQYNAAEETYDFGLPDGVVGQAFRELYFYGKNASGVIIHDGDPVMFAAPIGASGKVEIQLAIADGSFPSEYIMGIATHDIGIGEFGNVTWFGGVRGIDTTGTPYGEVWADGDLIYVGLTSGALTKVEPNAPNQRILVAAVEFAHATVGSLMLRPTWNPKLTDLDDVNGTALTSTGQIMTWDQASSYFDFTENITDYAKLDGTNQPFTGNLNVSKVDPEIRLTDTGNDEYTRITKSDTDNVAQRFNRVGGAVGDALNFDGGTAYGYSEPISIATNITISTWVYSDDFVQNGYIILKTPVNAQWGLFFSVSGYIVLRGGGAISQVTTSAHSPALPTDGGWHHIVATISGTTGNIYVDKVLWATGTVDAIANGMVSGTNDIVIGQYDKVSSYTLTGLIDETALWNRILTTDDISDLYNSGAGLYINKDENFPTSGTSQGLNLEALWHFDDGSGTSALDSSGNSNTVTLVSMADSDWVTGKVINPNISEVNVWKSDGSGYTWGNSSLPTSFEGTAFGFNNTSPVAFLDAIIPSSTQVGSSLKGAVSQSANLKEYQKSDGTLYAGVNNIGERFNYDNVKNWFGTGDDASVYYDGTDLIIDPQEAGIGNLIIPNGNAEIQTGDLEVQAGIINQKEITQIFSGRKTLTDGSATGMFEVALATGELVGADITYTIKVVDGTDFQCHTGKAVVVAVNKAGTVTSVCKETYSPSTEAEIRTAGTLTDDFTCTDGASKVTLNCDANTSLAGATLTIDYTITMHSMNVITAL